MGQSESQVRIFLYTMYFFIVVGIFISSWSIISTLIETESYKLNFCLTNNCLKYGGEVFKFTIDFIFGYLSFIATIATSGGIIVAILTYNNNVKTNSLSNHISHLQIFKDYFEMQLKKFDMLKESSFDIYSWYNMIFIRSSKGDMNISNEYKVAIRNIINEIEVSNIQSTTAKDGSFKYKAHQERLINILKPLGINISFYPRNDFFEIEGEVLELISLMNKAFCSELTSLSFPKRSYI